MKSLSVIRFLRLKNSIHILSNMRFRSTFFLLTVTLFAMLAIHAVVETKQPKQIIPPSTDQGKGDSQKYQNRLDPEAPGYETDTDSRRNPRQGRTRHPHDQKCSCVIQ
ncbi:uncharacterized protein LOC126847508 isoform X2 [Adelges cooleyi]|uniref:uncharacterized protein LOC126847508 isoform X2 n=1 Tax=Adelges cooleyi TaxID=133065 RepID=UPI00217F4192|nr:uncharacterized protein LOC126847508 isoform X2 [Adelges cooleyi]